MTTAEIKKVNKTINSLFDGQIIAGGDFTANATLWKNTGDVTELPAIISKTKSDPDKPNKTDWKLNVDHSEHNHFIHVGKKFDQVQDLFDEDVTNLTVKVTLQKPRPEADVASTIEYINTLDTSAAILKSYRDALTKGGVRVMLVLLPS